jgi:hypothetical protein
METLLCNAVVWRMVTAQGWMVWWRRWGGLGSDGRLKGLRAGAAATACDGLVVVAATDANGAIARERGY